MHKNTRFFILLLIVISSALFAAPESSGKLAGTETAFIDNNRANLGLMDSSYDISEILSVKTNMLFDIIGLYNIGLKVGYHFSNFFDLRIALGYTGFYLNEAQMLTAIVNSSTQKKGITVNSLDLGIKGQKVYFAIMLPVYGFNVNANFGMYQSKNTPQFMKGTLGIEKTLFDNHLAFFTNAGLYLDLPESAAASSSTAIYVNTMISSFYADGGMRFYMGDHFNMDIGVIYPGIKMSLGNDPDTGEPVELNLPVLPVFNFAYRF